MTAPVRVLRAELRAAELALLQAEGIEDVVKQLHELLRVADQSEVVHIIQGALLLVAAYAGQVAEMRGYGSATMALHRRVRALEARLALEDL